jgi:hypothetical protein
MVTAVAPVSEPPPAADISTSMEPERNSPAWERLAATADAAAEEASAFVLASLPSREVDLGALEDIAVEEPEPPRLMMSDGVMNSVQTPGPLAIPTLELPEHGDDANADGLNSLWSGTPARINSAPVEAPHAPIAATSPWDDGPSAVLVPTDVDCRPPNRDVPFVALDTVAPAVGGVTSQPLVVQGATEQCRTLMERVRQHHELGDFSGSLEHVEKVLELDSSNAEARDYLSRNEETLLKMYESKIGNLHKTPRQLMSPDQVIWLNLHHKAGFLLSRIDGSASFEDVLALSGMPRLETCRILAQLLKAGVIEAL